HLFQMTIFVISIGRNIARGVRYSLETIICIVVMGHVIACRFHIERSSLQYTKRRVTVTFSIGAAISIFACQRSQLPFAIWLSVVSTGLNCRTSTGSIGIIDPLNLTLQSIIGITGALVFCIGLGGD